ncbi:IS66 family transposase [Stieleria varia]|uniref:Transposase IS66 family protein n=1 Tax=Stieleria varia TaxID=2528005 RepID=A0A5C6BBD3_9BACT|nr:IS66 family transposase [Stieleria varia]TWU07834.1 Transposase IS66 family protein [Stieleria varia]
MPNANEIRRENQRLKRELSRREALLAQRESKFEQQLSTREKELTEQFDQRVRELTEQFQNRMNEVNRLHEEEIEQLKLEQKLLIERVFAHKSERYIDNPNQLLLELTSDDKEFNLQVQDAVEGLQIAADEVNDTPPRPPRKKIKKQGDGKFPEHMVKDIIDVDLSEEEKEGLKHIGYDPVHKLHMKRPEFWVVETRYHKYVDPSKEKPGVQSPPREEKQGFVKGDHYDSSVVAEIITNRFGYHQPFYRLQDLFGVSGWVPSRSTLSNLQSSAANLIKPFFDYLLVCVLQDSVIGTDDTGVKLLLPKVVPGIDPNDPKSGRAHEVISEAIRQGKRHVNAKMWAYRGVTVPINLFDFTVSRHRDGPDLFFIDSGFKGTLLGDCYGANTGIEMRSRGEVVHAACNAHARRGFKEALRTHEAHGRFFLGCYQELYDIEDRGAVMDADARLELRQSESCAVWNRMRDYIATKTLDLLPKDKMQSAINYVTNQWEALTRYMSDPLIPFDNNESEQLMRQVALGRKNWLFVGSVKSGCEMTWLMSLVSSAIRNHLHVSVYVKDVLDSLLAGSTDYERLRPDVWGEQNPEHRREYRTAEREAKMKRKREQRAIRRLLRQNT